MKRGGIRQLFASEGISCLLVEAAKDQMLPGQKLVNCSIQKRNNGEEQVIDWCSFIET